MYKQILDTLFFIEHCGVIHYMWLAYLFILQVSLADIYSFPKLRLWLFRYRRWQVQWDWFSHKYNVNIGRVVSDNVVLRRKMFILMNKLQNVRNENLRKRHFFLNWEQVIWIINSNVQYRWKCNVAWRWLLRNKALKSGEIKTLLLFQNLLAASRLLINPSLDAAAHCSFQSMPSSTLIPTSLSSSPTVHLRSSHDPLLRLRPMFVNFFRGVSVPNFNKIACGVLLVAVQQL